MLEPHVLGVHGRGPSVFRCKHRFGAAMEGAGLSDFTHEPLLGLFPSCVLPKNNDLMSHIHAQVFYTLDLNHTIPVSCSIHSFRFVSYVTFAFPSRLRSRSVVRS